MGIDRRADREDLVSDPIIDLVRELHAAEKGSEDYEKLREIVRQLALKANGVLYRIAANRTAAQLPPGAFAEEDGDPEEKPIEGAPDRFQDRSTRQKNPAV
ncbi:hypothetical protein IB244_01570 [Rhizobium sp. RHZ02]|uniref:hypothetical protein n=1 Tax=Rhizobium sp. RHZ02 TaxID=2769306 RepID=UPI0019A0D791|nr:hypothetical protein [Rhizobium sp. RHZ02]MBD9450270.1 hypothetical protein [Rhizobium sp. RHZ02]